MERKLFIKTKYESIEECISELVEVQGRPMLTRLIRRICGEVSIGGNFNISTTRSYSNLFEYKGNVLEKEDGIYLEGIVSPKGFVMGYLYFISIMCPILGIGYSVIMKEVDVFVFMLSIPILFYIYLKLSRSIDRAVKWRVVGKRLKYFI